MLDKNLQEYATARQWEILQTLDSAGSERKAAEKLGVHRKTVSKAKKAVLAKAAKQGYSPEHDLSHKIPDGYKLRGASTLYDRDGNQVLQWVKTTEDAARLEVLAREIVEALSDDLPKFKATSVPENTRDDLAACYPVGDHHFGMLSWRDETGEDYDLQIGQKLLHDATDHLISVSPACGNAVIAILGDFLHYDSMEAVTPAHKNILDADSRYPKMIRAAIQSIRYMIDECLKKHGLLHVIIEIGNHDPSSSIFLAECLYNVYENEPRITIDRSPSHYHYWQFGKNLVGVHHGDKTKLDKLPIIMATDRPVEWGASLYRYWWTGHVHHDEIKEICGVKCESFGILPPVDAYAHAAGYRAARSMKAIVLHKEFGEVCRHVFNDRMI